MKNLLILIWGSLLIFSGVAWAQTDSLNIYWDPNPEPDMYQYRLYRAVNDTTDFHQIKSIFHPNTHVVDRSGVIPGRLYAYKLTAMDSAGNESGFSETVAVGLPKITWSLAGISSGGASQFAFSDFLSDPDNGMQELQLSGTGSDHLSVSVSGTELTLTPVPINYTGNVQFTLTVEDPEGFWDQNSIQLNIGDIQNTAPELVNLPSEISFLQDGQYSIKLDSVVVDSTNSFSELSWEFTPGDSLNYNYDPSQQILLIFSTAGWTGESDFFVKVTDPDSLSDERNITVRVLSVEAPRLTNLPSQIRFPQDSLYTLNLKNLVVDSTNSFSELNWEYSGAHLIFQYKAGQGVLQIQAEQNWTGSTSLFLKVTDPDGLFDQRTIPVKVTAQEEPGELSGENIVAYPNPFRPSRGHNVITFKSLPSDVSEIMIFSPAGDLVYKEDLSKVSNGPWTWNVVTNDNRQVASGLYIYVIKNSSGKKIKSGKLAVIR